MDAESAVRQKDFVNVQMSYSNEPLTVYIIRDYKSPKINTIK